ncbi:MAG: hypothetical protein HOV68_03345, partial [Streptomycetaceae bacterium]|nr:hypothetical protein [Streptomycetaceae bacterium]
MRMVLALAALVCLGVFGYWGWTFFQGTADRVHEGDCIAALNGTDVKPLDCADAAARFQVKEIFKDTSDVTVCEMVLGASNPLVVDQDGRNDVWCAGPK